MMKVARVLLLSLVVLGLLSQTTGIAAASQQERPAEWAQPMTMKGVPNLHKVSDGLYRSAQPTADGLKNLKNRGIATVVDLRSSYSDQEKIRYTGLTYEHIYMKAWHPEERDIVRFLRIAADPRRTPVLVHCLAGADRTGTMCAIYRVAVQGWNEGRSHQRDGRGRVRVPQDLV